MGGCQWGGVCGYGLARVAGWVVEKCARVGLQWCGGVSETRVCGKLVGKRQCVEIGALMRMCLGLRLSVHVCGVLQVPGFGKRVWNVTAHGGRGARVCVCECATM